MASNLITVPPVRFPDPSGLDPEEQERVRQRALQTFASAALPNAKAREVAASHGAAVADMRRQELEEESATQPQALQQALRASSAPLDLPAQPLSQPPVTRRESNTTTSYAKVSPEEKKALAEQEKIRKASYEAAQKVSAARIGTAQAQAEADRQLAAQREHEAYRAAEIADQGNDELKSAQSRFDEQESAFKAQRYKGFWRGKDNPTGPGNRVLAALAIAMGGLGDALMAKGGQRGDHAKTVINMIDQAVERDWQMFRDERAVQERALEKAGVRVESLRQESKQLEHARKAAADELIAAQRAQQLSAAGVPAAQAEGDWLIQDRKEKAAAERLAYLESTRTRVQSQVQQVTMSGGADGRGGAKDTRLQASDEGLNSIASTSEAIKELGSAIDSIKATPKAWIEYNRNNLDWQRSQALEKIPGVKGLRGAAQGLGIAAVAPEENLRSEQAKQLHRTVASVKSALQKARGGAITDSDVAAIDSELAQAATRNPAEGIRLLAGIQQRLENKLSLYVQNRKVNLPPGFMGGGGPSSAATAPAGVRQTRVIGGKTYTGTLRPDGSFEADD